MAKRTRTNVSLQEVANYMRDNLAGKDTDQQEFLQKKPHLIIHETDKYFYKKLEGNPPSELRLWKTTGNCTTSKSKLTEE